MDTITQGLDHPLHYGSVGISTFGVSTLNMGDGVKDNSMMVDFTKALSALQTLLIINLKGSLLDGLELRLCKGKYNQRWGVSGVKKKSKIFLGVTRVLEGDLVNE